MPCCSVLSFVLSPVAAEPQVLTCCVFFPVNKCNSSWAQHLSLTLAISNEKGKTEEAKFSPLCAENYLASHQCFWHWAMGSNKLGLIYHRNG